MPALGSRAAVNLPAIVAVTIAATCRLARAAAEPARE
jgi:hypothetical protein